LPWSDAKRGDPEEVTMSTTLREYSYRGARAMVLLHEEHLRLFLDAWRDFRAAGLPLPRTEDPDYASPEALLAHVLGAARGYMRWMCEVLGLGDPGIEPVPGTGRIGAEADRYLAHVLEAWRAPLAGVPEERFYEPEYPSRWKVKYCVDAMLEHAVMHPIRHRFQLVELMRAGSPSLPGGPGPG
jgi:hypothetical protein